MKQSLEAKTERETVAGLKTRGVLEIAIAVLGRDNLRFDAQANYLWEYGRWVPRTLNEIMQAVNRRLVRDGRAQIVNNPAWRVEVADALPEA